MPFTFCVQVATPPRKNAFSTLAVALGRQLLGHFMRLAQLMFSVIELASLFETNRMRTLTKPGFTYFGWPLERQTDSERNECHYSAPLQPFWFGTGGAGD